MISPDCPLTPETRGLIGPWELALMRRDAILINTARGGLVDEALLADALRKGAGRGWRGCAQPGTTDGRQPAVGAGYSQSNRHTAQRLGSRESRQRLIGQLAENIQGYLDGEPVRTVG